MATWVALCLSVLLFGFGSHSVQGGKAPKTYDYGPCNRNQFWCLDGKCIPRQDWCDGTRDCTDNSDESHCTGRYYSDCPRRPYKFLKCANRDRCIPEVWVCDGVKDCVDNSDEATCLNVVEKINGTIPARRSAERWMLRQRKSDARNIKWGFQVHRIAVALYLSDPKFFHPQNNTGVEITYELSIQLLADLLRNQKHGVSTDDLALYLNALVVSCMDPRNFYGLDVISMLRKQFNQQSNYTNPFVLLSLCIAGDKMSQSDVDKLIAFTEDPSRPIWTDTQSLMLMALSCIAERSDVAVETTLLSELAMELKQRQHRNGSFENLHTTALVTQALFASGQEDDDWSMEDSVKYILSNQLSNGSFGNLLNTYYILPVLSYKSLLNVSSTHCKKLPEPDEKEAIKVLHNQFGTKIRVKYSLWFGKQVDVVRSLELLVTANVTLFDVMHLAAKLDSGYRFEYSVMNRKPYLYSVAEIQDDPESNRFWFLYKADKEGKKVILMTLSPVDIVPQDKDEYIMWYRPVALNKEHPKLIA